LFSSKVTVQFPSRDFAIIQVEHQLKPVTFIPHLTRLWNVHLAFCD